MSIYCNWYFVQTNRIVQFQCECQNFRQPRGSVTKSHRLVIDAVGVTKSHRLVIDTVDDIKLQVAIVMHFKIMSHHCQ